MFRACGALTLAAVLLGAAPVSGVEQTPGPWWHVVDDWEQVDVSLGFGFTSVSATVLIGSVDIPVWSLYSGTWRNPTNWSDVTVYYTRAQTLLDLTDPAGATLVEIDLGTGEATCPFSDFMETGPTNRPVTFPIGIDIPEVGEITVNLGTTVRYDVIIGHHIALDQSPTIDSLRIDEGGTLDVNDRYELTILEGPVNNAGEIGKTLGGGTFVFPRQIINEGTVSASSGTLYLTSLTNNGMLRTDAGGTLSVPPGVLTGSVVSDGTVVFRGVDVQTTTALTGSGKYQVPSGYGTTKIEGIDVEDAGLEVLGTATLSTYGTWTNVDSLLKAQNDTQRAVIQVPADRELDFAGTGTFTISGVDAKLQALGGTARVINGPAHTIQGWGSLSCALTNEGTVTANAGGKQLAVGSVQNSGTLRSENGGVLSIGGTIEGGTIISDGIVYLKNAATINGPALMTGSGIYYATSQDGVPLLDGVTVENTAIEINYGNHLEAWGTWTNVQAVIDGKNTGYRPDLRISAGQELNLAGAGTLTIAGVDAKVQTLGGSARVINGPAHTIQGWGSLSCALTNEGTVTANVSGKTLSVGNVQNSGTLRSENGGILSIGGTIDGGSIVADGTIYLKNAATINTPVPLTGSGLYYPTSQTGIPLLDGVDVEDTSITINYGNHLEAWGTWTNVQAVIDGKNTGYRPDLRISAGQELNLAGAGTLTIAGVDAKVQTLGGSARVINGPAHTIQGWGSLSCALTNEGTVTANRSGKQLAVGSVQNSGTLRSENGGILSIGGTIEGGTIIADGTIYLNNAATINAPASMTGSGIYYATSQKGTPLLNGADMANTSIEINYGNHLQAWGTWTNVQALIDDRHTDWRLDLQIPADRELNLAGAGTLTVSGSEARVKTLGGTARVINGPAHTIRGWGTLSCNLKNEGIVTANASAKTLVVGKSENSGVFKAENGSTLYVAGDTVGSGDWVADGGTLRIGAVTIDSTGSVELIHEGRLTLAGSTMAVEDLIMDETSSLSVGSTLSICGELTYATVDETAWSWAGSSTLEMGGGCGIDPGHWADWSMLEIGGEDLGMVDAGFVGNFNLPRLEIAAGAHVCLWDLLDNGNRSAGTREALYVDNLFIGEDAVLNTNGLSLYYKNLSGSGRIDDTIVPEPGVAFMVLCGGVALLIRRGRSWWKCV